MGNMFKLGHDNHISSGTEINLVNDLVGHFYQLTCRRWLRSSLSNSARVALQGTHIGHLGVNSSIYMGLLTLHKDKELQSHLLTSS